MNVLNTDVLLKNLKKGQIKACIINRNSETMFEFYKNKKAAAGLHAINSASKSVISMLVGICLRDGLITDIHTPLKAYFADYLAGEADSRKQELTLYHLLTMTPGFDWPEFGEWNYWSPMEFSKDIVKTVLERDLIAEPGTAMNYNSGCSNLLSAVIQKVTGMKTVEFAFRELFGPLGIKEVVWHEKQGINLGANGLKMRAEDMMKLGLLCLNEGVYEGRQIIPAEWLKAATQPLFMTYPQIGSYGYHWWVSELEVNSAENVPFYFALGLFGQYTMVVPKERVVAVFVSENYGKSLLPLEYFRELWGIGSFDK